VNRVNGRRASAAVHVGLYSAGPRAPNRPGPLFRPLPSAPLDPPALTSNAVSRLPHAQYPGKISCVGIALRFASRSKEPSPITEPGACPRVYGLPAASVKDSMPWSYRRGEGGCEPTGWGRSLPAQYNISGGKG
jgi:hypothetical protein